MLTIEMLKQSSSLANLTDEQLTAITEMSKNDENAVIGMKIGALHGQYDTDIFSITGVAKNDGEKSYDYAKRVLANYEAKIKSVKTIQDKLKAAESKVSELELKLEKNAGNDALSQQLKDSKAQVSQLQEQLKVKDAELSSKIAEYEASIKNTHIDYAFQAAVSGLKFKNGITESVQKILLNSAKAEILAKGTPDFIEDEQGNKKLVLRDKNGTILNNPKNNLNPYTIEELVMDTSLKDVIDEGRQQTGGGTVQNNSGGTNSRDFLDLSGVKNQIEADKIIESYLLANGLTRDSQRFAEQSLKIRTENKISDLPIR